MTFRAYLQSFRPTPQLGKPFAVDLLFFGLAAFLFTQLGRWLQNSSQAILQGKTPEELQIVLTSLPPEEALQLLQQVKHFWLFFLAAALLLVAATILGFSFTKAYQWSILHQHPFKLKWKWNILYLALIIPSLLYLLAAVVVKVAASSLFNWFLSLNPLFVVTHEELAQLLLHTFNDIIGFILVVLFLLFLFAAEERFSQHLQAWNSLGEAFGVWRKALGQPFLFILGTSALLSLLLGWFGRILFLYPQAFLAFQFVLGFLFIAWLRSYFHQQVHHGA